MDTWSLIAERWPEHLLKVRRRCAIDPGFREVVADYHEARCALTRWRGIDLTMSERVADYERLVRELESEIEAGVTPR
ncbi:MAG: hypothetical protein KDK29_12875 [Sedimentitalea sp.]|nr:hypothetical protein [Sedimentitalea sp.]